MDRLRTLLLARTHLVVLDPDRVASAATRPNRDVDTDKLEAELAELGFVMSLDLAMTIRRLPFAALQELRGWLVDTLATQLGAHRPHVPLFRDFPAGTPADTASLYLKRILSWLLTMPEQPCPWCGETKTVGALDPCGHLVCRACWAGGNYAGCPICHRRIAINDPFYKQGVGEPKDRVARSSGTLTLLHLGFDLIGSARQRFERLLARTTPLSPDDRAELEVIIDSIGPKIVSWLPERIPVKETVALVVARIWSVSPDRAGIVKQTGTHLRTATDVLRVAAVLFGGNAELVEPMKLGSISRGLRRAVLAALDALPMEHVVEDVRRHRGLWKRVGERLHPFELATQLPNAALAFAIVRGTDLTKWPALRALAVTLPCVRVEDEVAHAVAWATPIEDALRLRNPRSALGRLTHRPGELLRRADHLVRIAQDHQVDALETVVKGIRIAVTRGAPGTLLTLGSHLARRGGSWPRRVFFPKGEVLKAWSTPDRRPLLRGDAIGAIVGGVRHELLVRAEARRNFPRAVIDRALADLLVPINERSASPAKLAWPRGSELAIPAGDRVRLFLHWEEPANNRVDLDLSVAFYDHGWRHVETCDFTNLVVGRDRRAAVHSGDLTSAPPPLGASEFVDLEIDSLRMIGARHAVMVVFSYNAVPFDRLTHGFAGLMRAPAEGAVFDPRAVQQRFDLRGRSMVTVPLTIDLAERRLRWLDVHVASRGDFHQVGGYRAALAHIGKDFQDLVATHARPTMWDLAAIHAAARANLVYVRERDGSFTTYRRRDHEPVGARLARLISGGNDEGKLATIPVSDAPTWFALVTGDLALPAGSTGYMLDGRASSPNITRLTAGDLVAELAKQ